MDPTTRFTELVQGPPHELALDEAALLIAAHARPGLDVAAELRLLDRLAAGIPAGDLHEWRRHLFVDLGFSGNVRRYADPRNSFLNEVLDRRVGIPISLSLVYIEVARRAGVSASPVGFPGHFLARVDDSDRRVVVDPGEQGRLAQHVVSQAGAQASIGGLKITGQPDMNIVGSAAGDLFVAEDGGGGDGISPSRPDAPHGFGPATSPRFNDHTK